MFIDKKSPIPAYYQLRSILLKKIENGEFEAGSLIPSERDLSETLGLSRMTVRQALNRLVSEGVLYREKGKGTFVSRIKFEQKNIMSFSELVRKKGLTPSTRVLNFFKDKADQDTAGLLELKTGESLYALKRLRLANNLPVGIEEVFIPEKYCTAFEKNDLTASLFALFKENYGYVIGYVDSIIEASKPSGEERKLLAITARIPVLRTSSVYSTETGMKLFFEKSSYRSDEYKYNVRFYVNKEMD